ncbi:hypothetical protein P170DRAFT_467259 [Aspergillus steynii IBT 23096]|uniref:P-loop containing nucleoside triphosphate hydrolase protein n=1 Tax=Aspergillus steynii IBT 23096 TaxID=1392250 RepID=A0A2I2FZQ3_9EURO|nr:uncharacterized protein P170DRAFT_467259 [Aspergillus steynii IBT 23096]PLB46115.1 hypothetical protein P170DRAFT_467259 [Aspergillus steynii IBT 23096]
MDRPDFLGLSSQTPQRVVSFPASQSLHASTASATTAISTGLARLDEALCPSSLDDFSGVAHQEAKGIPGGHVTEVFGPPGVGKTSLALNLPKPPLHPNPHPPPPPLPPPPPPQTFPPPNTTLLIIDSISALFQPYYPAPSDLKSRLSTPRTDRSQLSWLLNRRWNVTSDLASQLSKLAATHSMAVMALNQMHTRIKGLPRATLTPVLAGGGWETGVFARVGIYRDFVREGQYPDANAGRDGDSNEAGQAGRLRRVRFAEVMKRNGRAVLVRREEDTVVPFLIEMDGLHALDEPASSRRVETQKVVPEPELELPQTSEPDSGLRKETEQEHGQEPAKERTPEPELEREPLQNVQHQREQETEPEQENEPEQSLQGQQVQQEPTDSLDTTRKRKVDEIADSQDEDSDGEFGWNEDDDAGLLERH